MGGAPGIKTGVKSIDINYPTGLAPGHLIVAIGWPAKGKTWFASYLACKAWEQGFHPMIVSLEMSPENMRDRIYTMMGSGLFSASGFSRGDVNLDNFRAWGNKTMQEKPPFTIVSTDGMTEMTPAMVEGKVEQHRPNLVIADYHQLFTNNGRSNSPIERAMNISREFKRLAVSREIALIDITAATSDDVSDRDTPPMMSQVAWSKAIEYDADLAFAVHREGDTNLINIVGRKNRFGDLFDFYMNVDLDRGTWEEQF
jgi:replicative DNA helicase